MLGKGGERRGGRGAPRQGSGVGGTPEGASPAGGQRGYVCGGGGEPEGAASSCREPGQARPRVPAEEVTLPSPGPGGRVGLSPVGPLPCPRRCRGLGPGCGARHSREAVGSS